MKWLDKIEEMSITIAIFIATIVIFVNVILRNFGESTSWAEELVRYLFIFITFIGSSVCVRKGAHLGVDVLPDLLPARLNTFIQIVVNVAAILFLCIFTWLSFQVVQFSYSVGQLTPALRLPIVVVYAVILIGMFLMLIRYIQSIYFLFRGKTLDSSKEFIS